MSDWTPQVVVIEKIEKHSNADNLSIATVMNDYPVIIKTGQYEVGQLACYINIDTIVPDTKDFHFLCPLDNSLEKPIPKYSIGSVPERYRRIKAKKIRGIYSQGMLVNYIEGLNIGDSVVDKLGLTKWEEIEEDNVPTFRGNVEKAPDGWCIPYYDIDSVRKYISCLQEGEEIVLTEKIHGSNASFCYDGNKLWVKSRNYYKKQDISDIWWSIALRYNLEDKLAQFPKMIFFGEIYGQVKGFRYDTNVVDGRLETRVRFFDILDLKSGRYLDYDCRVDIINKLGLDTVPELYRGKWLGKEKMYIFAEGKTLLGGKHLREGWVLNTLRERFESRLGSRMQVKLVGEGYNLQK